MKGKSKLLKHICALSNSNPYNESFLIVGVSNNNTLIGVDFIDDSKVQDLNQAYFENAPVVKDENIAFPTIEKDKSTPISVFKNRRIYSFGFWLNV
jgi:predicted HTH transcriptional regulator